MFSAGIERAIEAALEAHAGQVRRGGDSPYVVHPLHAAFMLARLGLPEVAIQAALLHDVVEDSERWDLPRVEREFGAEVAAVVAQLTEDKSGTWEERKREGVARVAGMCDAAVAVKAADKLHNLSTLSLALWRAEDRDAVWARFRGGRERTLAMAAELVDALAPRAPAPLGRALRAALAELERAAAGAPGAP